MPYSHITILDWLLWKFCEQLKVNDLKQDQDKNGTILYEWFMAYFIDILLNANIILCTNNCYFAHSTKKQKELNKSA